jgi:threonyl-tRNA synthetase
MLVVGDKEAAAGEVAVRLRTGADLGSMPIQSFLDLATAAVRGRSGVE